jgi:putative membrane protein
LLTIQMAGHIASTNFAAPVTVLAMIAFLPPAVKRRFSDNAMLVPATLSQIAVLWIAHAPFIFAASVSSAIAHFGVLATLYAVGLWFWWAIFLQTPQRFWRALFALLITGKLFCLLGALLVFAPRPLYAHHGAYPSLSADAAVNDQQLAGLLMLLACPLSYVIAGIVIAFRSLRALDASDASPASLTTGA